MAERAAVDGTGLRRQGGNRAAPGAAGATARIARTPGEVIISTNSGPGPAATVFQRAGVVKERREGPVHGG